MSADHTQGGERHSTPRHDGGGMGRLIFRVASQLFGGRMDTFSDPDTNEERPTTASQVEKPSGPSVDAANILERALSQVEALLGGGDAVGEPAAAPARENPAEPGELEGLKRSLRDAVSRLETVLDHAGVEAQRLAAETARVADVANRLEAALAAIESAPQPSTRPAPEPVPAEAEEPLFLPAETTVGITISSVPGFQGLMDVQRGLSGLASVEGASVSRYRNGEAALSLALRAPLGATAIVETLRLATGKDLVIEESAPADRRLRLRFAEGGRFGAGNGAASSRLPADAPSPR